MTKLKILFIFSIEILLIFCCITNTAFGINLTNNESVQSGDTLNPEVSNVYYSYNHYFFGLNSYGNTIITRYGKLPMLETDEQKESWNSTLEELSKRIKDTVASKYMYPHGEVMTCGINAKGYFVILFKYGNVDESLMNEIYALIDNYGKEMGIQDIPVEFGYGIYREQLQLSQEGRYHWLGESTENLSESDIRIIEENMKKKPEQLGDGSIANYGKIPLLKGEKEFNAWGDKLELIVDNIREKMYPYIGKGVMSYGYGFTRLEVAISESLSFEEKSSLAKEIYQIVDEEAKKQNVTDVPVIFKDKGEFEEINLLVSEEEDEELYNSNNNYSEPNNGSITNVNSSSGNKSSKNNSTPGFGLLGGLVCLFGVWRLRNK